jgi:hypothetical protein
MGLGRYENLAAQTRYAKFVLNGADIEIGDKTFTIKLKKKRELPFILEVPQKFGRQNFLLKHV